MSTESIEETGASAHIRRSRCREALERAAASHASRLDALPSSASGVGPRPGDTYLSRSTADFPVEWLVVEQASDGRGRRCRVLPVDVFPLVGSEDFRFPEGALGGPQVGRCGFPTWLDADRFEPDLRTGALAPDHLRALRHKLGTVESRRLRPADAEVVEPKPSEDEVDGDPEYHQWRDRTLRRAVAALAEMPEAPTLVPLFGAPPPAASPWTRVLVLAALLLLTLAPAAWTVLRLSESLEAERQRVATLESASEAQAAELASVTAEKVQAGEKASRLETELADLRRAMDAGQEALQATVDTMSRELAQAMQSKIVENIPILRLDSRSRSTRTSVTRSAATFHVGNHDQVLLEIDVHDAEPYSTYEACLNGGTASPLCLAGLTLQDGRFLRVALPVDRLHEELKVTLRGEKRGQTTVLDEQYNVRIER